MKRYNIFIITILFVQLCFNAKSQTTVPCSAPEVSQFDFWIGDWILTYSDTVHAKNHIERLYDKCVIHENFDDPTQTFKGQSWSVYKPMSKKWVQTWVDNQGSYIALSGGMEGDKMVLMTEPFKIAGDTLVQTRMIFYNIAKNSFDWNWEMTKDTRKTWQVNWKIHYERQKN